MTTLPGNKTATNNDNRHEKKRQFLHQQIDRYMDALLTHEEMVQSVPRFRYGKPELTADPGLATGFTAIGIAALLVRVAIIRAEVGASQAPVTWTISETGTLMSGNLMLRGDQVHDEMVPLNGTDFSWIFPSVTFDLPEGAIIGDILPKSLRSLSVVNSILMTDNAAKVINEMRNEGLIQF